MSNPQFTSGPWELVEGTEHHGPYVCSPYGTTLCDLYVMSNPAAASVRNGGESYPIWHPDARENARLIAAAPELYEALRLFRDQYGDRDTWPDDDVATLTAADAALAKVEGQP